MTLTSVLIPSRDEFYLAKTVQDILVKAAGPVEVIAVLDGYWPEPPLDDYPNVHLIHWSESKGMRAAINAAASIAKGEYLLKLDSHCSISEHWDNRLKSLTNEDVVQVPIRYKLNADTWERFGDPREFQYIRREDFKGRDWPEYAERVKGQSIL